MDLLPDPLIENEQQPPTEPVQQDPQKPQEPQGSNPILDRLRQKAAPQPATDAGGNSILDRLQTARDQQGQLLQNTFTQAVKFDPELAGEAQRLGMETGNDPALVARNIERVRQFYATKAANLKEMLGGNSVLGQFFTDPEFAKIAHDEVPHLSVFERWVGSTWGAAKAGALDAELSNLWERKASGKITDPELDRLREITYWLRQNPPPDGFIAGFFEQAGMLAKMAPEALAAGSAAAGTTALVPGAVEGPQAALTLPGAFATGATVSFLHQLYRVGRGASFRTMVNNGYDPKVADFLSSAAGLTNAALMGFGEGAVLKGIGKPLQAMLTRDAAQALVRPTLGKAVSQFAGRAAANTGIMSGLGAAQRGADIAFEEAARRYSPNPDAPEHSSTYSRGEAAQEILDAAAKTAVSMAIFTSIGPSLRFIEEMRTVKASEEARVGFDKSVDLAADSKVRTRNPEAFQAVAQAMDTANDGPHNVYMQASKVGEVLEQLSPIERDNIFKQLPDLEKQITTAPDLGDVVMPVAEYQAKIAGTAADKLLRPHTRLVDPENHSPAEMEELRSTQQERLAEVKQLLAEKQKTDQAFVESAQKVEDRVFEQVKGVRSLRTEQSHAFASLMRDFVVVGANEEHVTPEEFYAKRGLKVVSGQAPAEGATVFSQDEIANQWAPILSGDLKSRVLQGLAKLDSETQNHFANKTMQILGSGNFQAAEHMLDVAKRHKLPWLADLAEAAMIHQPHFKALQEAGKHVREVRAKTGEIPEFDTQLLRTFIKSQEDEGHFKQQARGSFDPKSLTAFLYEKGDASTLIHESAHYFLTVYSDLVARAEASPAMRADFQTLLDWFGVKDQETWNGLSLEQQRKNHEKFAYSFENYVLDGKAPSVELRTVFERFKRWLLLAYKNLRDTASAIYKREHGEDLPILTPAVRSVMDRMLASQEQIRQAEQIRAMVPHFQTEEEFVKAGNPAEEYPAYQQVQDERHQEAESSFIRASLRDMSWLRNQKKGLLAENQAEHDVERARVKGEVSAELDQQPVYRAINILRGKIVDPDTGEVVKSKSIKLDRDAVRAEVVGPMEKESRANGGPEGEAYAQTALLKFRGMLDDHGIDLETAADLLEYTSGEKLLRDIVEAPKFEDAVEAKTNERMLMEHGELVDPKQREAAIERALHNEAHTRFLATELRSLSKATQPTRMIIAAAKQSAREIIANTPIRKITFHEFSTAEKRASLAVMDALKKGNREDAANFKRQQLVQSALVSEALAAEKEIDTALDKFKPMFRPNEKVALTRNTDIAGAARAILAAYSIGPKDPLPLNYMALLKANDPAFFAELQPEVIAATRGNTLQNYRDLTLDQFRDLRDTAYELWHKAELAQQVLMEGKAYSLRAAVTELAGQWRSLKTYKGNVLGRQLNKSELRAGSWLGWKAWLTQVEHWARFMDGGVLSGPTMRFLVREVFSKADDYFSDRQTYGKKFRDMVTALDLPKGQIEAPELGYTFRNKAELMHALLNTGNESNMRKMLRGMRRADGGRWAELLPGEDGAVDETPWWEFRQRMIDRGVLTEKDFKFARDVWDMNEELSPKAQKTLHDLQGYYFEKIEPRSQMTPWGEVKGGYVPVRIDTDAAKRVGLQPPQQREGIDGLLDMEREFKESMTPSTGRSFTKERSGSEYPIVLDVRAEIAHFDQVLRFIHLQPAVRSVLRLLRDPELVRELNRVNPLAIDKMFLPWLTRAARNSMTDNSKFPAAINQLAGILRRNAGMAAMFAVPMNILSQTTGAINSLNYVPARHLLNATWKWMQRELTGEMVAESSKAMDARLKHQMARIQDDVELVLDPTTFGAVQRWTQRKAYLFQNMIWNTIDTITWGGAYDHAMERLGDAENAHDTAVHEADEAVRMSQSSNRPVDVATYAEGTPVWRALTQFSSYANTMLNSILYAQPGKAKVKAALMMMIVPALVSGAIQKALWGGWQDKDHDGYSDEYAKFFFGAPLQAAATMVPVFGPAAMSLLESGGDRLSLSPTVTTGVATAKAVAAVFLRAHGDQREFTGKNLRDILTGLSLSGLPFASAGRPVEYMKDVSRGQVVPSGPRDYVRGLLTGAASPGTHH